ncbi:MULTISPECIES: hypothetical protein [unclassified Enterococcus]|uniref:hypothetical protein n=1 Tax=unclassified Enterococcus TaxID=2608891 RepID=UPI003D2AB968
MKRETYTLSKRAAIDIIKKLLKKKKHFSFKDIEEQIGRELTSEDKFMVRSIVVKKFNMKVVYLSPFNQLRFYRNQEKG